MGAGGEVVIEQRKSVDEWILKRFIFRKRRNIERKREREIEQNNRLQPYKLKIFIRYNIIYSCVVFDHHRAYRLHRDR